MVKENINSHMEDLESECEILWLNIEIASYKPLYIPSYYRFNHAGAESPEQLEVFLDMLPQGNSHIWLAGEMNFTALDWPTTNLKPTCPTPAQHNKFLDVLADQSLTQIIEQPTWGANTLDLLALNGNIS